MRYNLKSKSEKYGVDAAWAKDCRKRYLVEQIGALRETLIRDRIDMGQSVLRGDAFEEALVGLGMAERTARLRTLAAELRSLEGPSTQAFGRVTDDDAVKAREFPLQVYLEVKDGAKVLCPWHEDKKPSFFVKSGFGYCFTCGKSANTVDWAMKVDGLSFVDAVRKINGA